MSFANKLKSIVEKSNLLEAKLLDSAGMSSNDFIKISKEHAALGEVVALSKQYLAVQDNIAEAQEIIANAEYDADFKEMAQAELTANKKELDKLTQQLKIALLPKDEADEKSAILEVRAGTGGDEAALFAANLFRMYQRYAEAQNWKFEVLSITETGLEGYKEASASIRGNRVFAKLKFESGVHRVQRIPETESSGRIHTSAATVAVLPEAEEVDIHIDENDLRIDVFRASGCGGQHVNTTDSAVRITHIPTGVVVSIQDEKSQHKNKAKAMKILRSRIYEAERARKDAERSSMRKGMVGSGDRSERIRTYNYPQSRVTDHRINFTTHNLDGIINNGELDELAHALIAEDQAQKLAAQMEEK